MKSGFVLFVLTLLTIAFCIGCRSHVQPESKFQILPGAYQIQDYLPDLQNRKVAIVANHTSYIGNTHLIDSLVSLGISVKMIFTPEHGLQGNADAGTKVNNGLYKGIPVISLYGNKKKPSVKDLDSCEVVVFDLQDVGARFYTYISTLTYVMETCVEADKPLIVLDRPNPNGFYVDGPVLNTQFSSFIGLHPIPVVYGMTIGEYALMVKGEHWFNRVENLDLKVMKCLNYAHSSRYKLPIHPSPNLPNMRSVYLYPSLCFFEGTEVSVGRGTDFPFQVIGCPEFSDTGFSFTPESKPGASLNPPYKGKTCFGMDLRNVSMDSLVSRHSLDLSYLLRFYSVLNDSASFFKKYFTLLAGTNALQIQIEHGMSEKEIRDSWQKDIKAFKKIRIKYLLYPDFE